MGEEASEIDGGPVHLTSIDQVLELGTNGVPDLTELGVEDFTDRLDRNIALGLGEGSGEEILFFVTM